MKMTREEAIQNREDCLKYLEGIGKKASPGCVEAMRWSVKALKAFRPVSREQVEKMWRGEWKRDKWPSGTHRIICNRCGEWNGKTTNFCSHCGAPMTDEAVEMVMERLEALKDGKGD